MENKPAPTVYNKNEREVLEKDPNPHYRNGSYARYSNASITRRNGGVVHQFIDSIGGCAENYR